MRDGELLQSEGVVGQRKGARDAPLRRIRKFPHAVDEKRPRQIHQPVDQLRRDDLARQSMMFDLDAEILDRKLGEIRHQQAVEIG